MRGGVKLLVGVEVAVIAGLASAGQAAAAGSPSPAGGDPIHVLRPSGHFGSFHSANRAAVESSNWFGYQLDSYATGTSYDSADGAWNVPTASQHTPGEPEASSDWVGIGGGCIDANCDADQTLIQVGTNQVVSATGATSYSAWYELIPAAEHTIPGFIVRPGDVVTAGIAETSPGSGRWVIEIEDSTRGERYTTSVNYSSSHASAEWIEEALTNGVTNTISPLPNLTMIPFVSEVDGAYPDLDGATETQLAGPGGQVIGTPSSPRTPTSSSTANGFYECTWTSQCPPPSSAPPPISNPLPTGSGSVRVKAPKHPRRGSTFKYKVFVTATLASNRVSAFVDHNACAATRAQEAGRRSSRGSEAQGNVTVGNFVFTGKIAHASGDRHICAYLWDTQSNTTQAHAGRNFRARRHRR